jgi:hypothetical protein
VIDTETPGSAGWWLKMLAKRLSDRRQGRSGGQVWSRTAATPNRVRPGIDLLDDYRRGEPPLNTVSAAWQPHVREYMRMGRLHVADLVVASTANRMQLRDFRTAAANDELGDQRARDIMRANGMKVKFRELHEDMLGLADAYAIVTPPDGDRWWSLITTESPQQAITAEDPATGETLAGLKVFRDDWDSADFAYVFLPGRVFVAVKRGASSLDRPGFTMARSWAWDDDREQNVPNNRVPMVHYRNRDGVGEFERHLGTLDRLNELVALEWWIAKIQAHRQRGIRNLPDVDDETGEEIDWSADLFVADPAAMWRLPEGTEIWESQPTDVTPVTNAIEKTRQRIASVTQVPLNTITPDAAAGSAEGASLQREEHVFKILDRLDRADAGHAKLMALAFEFMGDLERADVTRIEPLWGPVERFSLAEKASAAAQARTSLPTEAIQTDIWQYPPAELANLRLLRGRDLLFQEPIPVSPQQPTLPA